MKNIRVIKYSGEHQAFDSLKLTQALMRAGASENLARDIVAKIIFKTKERSIKTKEIYRLAKKYLLASSPVIASRFSLREAIIRLGPAGFDFEKYMMLVLRAHGFDAYLPDILQGRCITHEVDIVATKNNLCTMIECKLRNDSGMYVAVKESLAAYARFLDLKEGFEDKKCIRFDQACILTNNRFSDEAYQYGVCKGIKMISWGTPKEMPLPAYIDSQNLYPITVLRSMNRGFLKAFSEAEILLIKDLTKISLKDLMRLTGINSGTLMPIISEAQGILDFKN